MSILKYIPCVTKTGKNSHEFDGFFKKSGDLGALDESDVHRKYVILANYISSSLESWEKNDAGFTALVGYTLHWFDL